MPPTVLLDSLHGVRRRVRMLGLVYGVGVVLATAVGLLLATVLVDYLLNLPGIPRVVIMLLATAGVGYVAWRWVLKPLMAQLTLSDVAGRLEQAFPQFNDRLRSTVDFVTSEIPGSEVMKQRVVGETTELATRLDLSRAVVATPAWYSIGAGLGAVILTILLSLFMQNYASVAFSRLLSPFANNQWPKRVQIALAGETPQRVPVGQRVDVRMKLIRGDRASARSVIFYQYDDGPVQRELMIRDKDGVYTASLDARVESGKGSADLKIWMQSGDDEMRLSPITVVPRLSIRTVEAQITPPAYVSDGKTTTVNLMSAPALVADGSNIKLTVVFNKPLAGAAPVEIVPASSDTAVPAVQWTPESAVSASGTWLARQTMRFHIKATDTDNFTNNALEEFEIVVRPDQIPSVQIENPRRNEERTASSLVPFMGLAEDDYGIQWLKLAVERIGDKKTWEIPLIQDNAGVPGVNVSRAEGTLDRLRLRASHQWELSQLADANLKAGDVLEYYLIGKDNFALDGQTHQEVTSGRLRINIITPEDAIGDFIDRLRQMRDQIQGVRNQQERTRQQTQELANDVRQREQLDAGDLAAAQRLTNLQATSAAQTRQIAGRIAELLDQMAQNRLDSQELQNLARDVANDLQQAAENPMRQATQQLSALARQGVAQQNQNQQGGPATQPGTPSNQQTQQQQTQQAQANQQQGNQQANASAQRSPTTRQARAGASQQSGQQNQQQDQDQQANANAQQQGQQAQQDEQQQQNGQQASANQQRTGQQQSGQQQEEQQVNQQENGQQQGQQQANVAQQRSGQQQQQPSQQQVGQQQSGQQRAQQQSGQQQSGQQQQGQQANANQQRSGQQQSGQQQSGQQQSGQQQQGQQQSGQQQANQQQQQDGQQAPTQQERQEAFAQAIQQQQQANEQLDRALERMASIGSMQQQIQRLRDILNQQREISEQTREVGRENAGRTPEQMSQQDREQLEQVADEQQRLAEQTARTLEEMQRMAQQMQRSDPASSQAMQRAAQRGQQQQTSQNQQRAAQQARQNQQGQAQAAQRQAEMGLEMMLNDLNEAERHRLSQLQRQLEELQAQIDRLIQRQAGHNIDNLTLQGAERLARIDVNELADLMSKALRNAGDAPEAVAINQLSQSQELTERNTRDLGKTAEQTPNGAQPAAHLTRAAGRMERAIIGLRDNKLPDAYDPNQIEALAELEAARKVIAEQQSQVDQQLEEQQREGLRQRYVKVRDAQVKLNEEVARIDGARAADGALARPEAVRLTQLPDEQGKLAEEVNGISEDLAAATSVVYVWANKDIVQSMNDVKSDLSKQTTGVPTRSEQTRVVAQLNAMIKNLQVRPRTSRFAQEQQDEQEQQEGQQGQGQRGPRPPRLPPEAEIRMLQDLQRAVNESTKTIDAQPQKDEPKLVALGGRQGELRGLLDELLQNSSRGRLKLGPEPDNKDQLPEEAKPEEIENQELDQALLQGAPDQPQAEQQANLIGDRMARSRQRLALNNDPGKITQLIQERIILDFDTLIQQAQQQEAETRNAQQQRQQRQRQQQQQQRQQQRQQQLAQQQQQQQQGQQNQNQDQQNNPDQNAADASRLPGQRAVNTDLSQQIRESNAEWGTVSPRLRDAVLDGADDEIPPDYFRIVSEYFKSVADKGAGQ